MDADDEAAGIDVRVLTGHKALEADWVGDDLAPEVRVLGELREPQFGLLSGGAVRR
ncbi:hypothetical protein ACFTZK_00280 [Streptomyces decoyicus]|uniref:hypothetical protein n=1 Tax=Streptomyces decoyicus TaxID=249567 RepID=UPI0036381865